MKKFLSLLFFIFPSYCYAGITQIPSLYQVWAPDTESSFLALFCQESAFVQNTDTGITYIQKDCAGSPYNLIYSTPATESLLRQTTLSNFASTLFTGTVAQYVRGDGSLATLPSSGALTFNYPSRALNSCYQISSTKDADFHYKVDVTTGLSLTTGAQGTVTATSYTNSGCTTGSQALTDGTASQTGTLVIGLGVNQTVSVGLNGTLPAGKWLKITTANTVGTPTFSIRAVQSEVLH